MSRARDTEPQTFADHGVETPSTVVPAKDAARLKAAALAQNGHLQLLKKPAKKTHVSSKAATQESHSTKHIDMERESERQTEADRQTDRDRQTERQRDRQ